MRFFENRAPDVVCHYRELAVGPCAVPDIRIESFPVPKRSLYHHIIWTDQTETGDVDPSVPEAVDVEFVDRLKTSS